MIGMRNRIVHGYDDLDPDSAWKVAAEDVERDRRARTGAGAAARGVIAAVCRWLSLQWLRAPAGDTPFPTGVEERGGTRRNSADWLIASQPARNRA
jgi:hypothetical protein